jgi:hypothetical protein
MWLQHKEEVRFTGTAKMNREWTMLRTGTMYADVRDNEYSALEGGHIVSHLENVNLNN